MLADASGVGAGLHGGELPFGHFVGSLEQAHWDPSAQLHHCHFEAGNSKVAWLLEQAVFDPARLLEDTFFAVYGERDDKPSFWLRSRLDTATQ